MIGMERGENLSERRYMEKLSTMKKRMVVAMGWFLMALLLLPVGAMAQTKQNVTITVTNGTTPMKDATVTIVDENGKPYKADPTGDNGVATVPGVLAPTTGTVTVEASGTFVTAPVKVDKDGKADPDKINLARVRSVTVSVVDAVTNKGIEGATVTIGAQNAGTDVNGVATLTLVNRRVRYSVSATANGYADNTMELYAGGNSRIGQIRLAPVKGVTGEWELSGGRCNGDDRGWEREAAQGGKVHGRQRRGDG